MWCPNCGTEFRAGFTVCTDCGVSLVAERPTAALHVSSGATAADARVVVPTAANAAVGASSSGLYCTQCGAARSASARFCGSCGQPTGTVSSGVAPPAQWTAPPPPYPVGAPLRKQSTNGFAIASMVLGIIWIYWIGSILALVFGYQARKQIAQSEGTEGGSGMATAGIVLGWIGVATLVSVVLLVAVAALGGSGST